ncbi:putative membrane protein [Staphylococcus phage vB_SauM_LM12]|nr:putative membrane protein [Staphylococcus phage vB_SauM_LM12]
MNKVLEFVMSYIICLVAGFLGVWVGNLILGIDTNVFTSPVPYVIALVVSLPSLISKKEKG